MVWRIVGIMADESGKAWKVMYLITENHFKGIAKVAVFLRQYAKLGVCHYHNAIRGGGFSGIGLAISASSQNWQTQNQQA